MWPKVIFIRSLPSLRSGGLSTLQLKDFFNKSIFYNAVAGLTQPIFNQGINKARLRTAQAQQQQALNSFQQTLLVAGQEVSDALYAHQTAKEKEDARGKQIIALQKSVSTRRNYCATARLLTIRMY
jgi:multidrug efflux system outer membrane protein